MVKTGQPFRPWDTRPQLLRHLGWVWNAFHELQTCRPVGMALGPIPWIAIHEWAHAKEVADTERFERLIRGMDAAFLEHHHRDRERKEQKQGG